MVPSAHDVQQLTQIVTQWQQLQQRLSTQPLSREHTQRLLYESQQLERQYDRYCGEVLVKKRRLQSPQLLANQKKPTPAGP